MEALTASAQKDRYTEFKFKLFDAAGEAWLRNIATLGSAAEVAFFRNGDQIAKLSDEHALTRYNSVCWMLAYSNRK